ncbi:MAG: hypothetical protein ACHQ51_02735 [Elusimicrobiota bacterium]
MRRSRVLSALIPPLLWAAPGWAALAHLEPIASAPAPVSAPALSALSPLSSPSPLSSVLTALAPMLAPAPAAPMPLAPVALTAPAAANSRPPVEVTRDADGRPSAVYVLKTGAARIEKAPEESGRLFDAAPAAPDFEALTPVRAPRAPAAWTPRSLLLKPVAAAVNAWNISRHEIRLKNLGPGERVTGEERSLRESLGGIHRALSDGRFQDALQTIAEHFQTGRAAGWYRENPQFSGYRAQAFAYLRFAEATVKTAYERADRRGLDLTLVSEADAASRAGAVLGHAWRGTPIQEKDSSLCAQNAFYNAITASVGFVRPASVADFVAASRAALNRASQIRPGVSPQSAAALEREFGINFGRRDVGQGMDADSLREWASVLGMKLAARGPPRDVAGWSALIGPGREVLLSLRIFHRRFPHDADERALRGHDYRTLHHEVYLLGAFDSPSRGERLFMVQDSGSGTTLLATAAELSAMTQSVEILRTAGPVALPPGR